MSPDLRQRFERLLLDHPQWDRETSRRSLLGILRDHEIWDDLDLSGSPASATVRLLDLYQRHGPHPFRAALSALRDGRTDPAYLGEIATLDAELRALEIHRPRQSWKGVPYRGLAYFDKRHAPIFFGREIEVEKLIRTLTTTEQGRRFTVVSGASGAGKSSLVRAGLWARLAGGDVPELPGSERWLISVMTPLEMGTPEASFRASLLRAVQEHDGFEDKHDIAAAIGELRLSEAAERMLPTGDTRWILILDQMEELFSPDRQDASTAFLDRLLEGTRPGAADVPSRFQVLATLRADFFHHCLNHEPLKRAVQRDGGHFLLSAPGRLHLERMVSGPLTEVDLLQRWTLDPGLPSEMAADAWRHPGGLALMAFALRELYERCECHRRLDLATYRSEAFGGLGGAIARRADATLAELGESGPAALSRVFARLVRVNQDDAPTRRRERRSTWDNDPQSRQFIDAFVKARLLVADGGSAPTDDPVIEVAHEALLREWPRLAAWIDQRREAFRIADSVRAEAHAWMEGDPAKHSRRPWAADVIEDRRKKLQEAVLLEDLQRDDPAVARFLTPEVDWILAELKSEATTHQRRRDIGQRLAEVGDPRPGFRVIDGVPEILWRPIPGGEVEIEEHGRFAVAPLHMAAFPVTFGQFRTFLDAKDGFQNNRWWKELKREEPAGEWRDPLVNHPLTHVSWYDATAFCRWLSARFRFEVRLPDEQEWQWAAQSAQKGFVYPWGPEWREGFANTAESGIHRTTAVGMYPRGDSRQGVSDLAGNVWEWCRNEHDNPRQIGPGGEESRVVRGGDWAYDLGVARAGFRSCDYHPYFRCGGLGFRVVCSSPIR